MNPWRSFCLTCRKEQCHTNLLSYEEAMRHRENFVNHHVFINPDTEKKNEGDNEVFKEDCDVV